MSYKLALLCVLLIVAGGLFAQSVARSQEPAAQPLADPTAAVTIASFAYQPEDLRVAAGTVVTWTNNDVADHDVITDDRVTIISPLLSTGESYAQRLDRPGIFTYFCSLHPSMVGTITVEEPVLGSSRLHLPLLRGDSQQVTPGLAR